MWTEIEILPAGKYYVGEAKVILRPEIYQHTMTLLNGIWQCGEYIIGLFQFYNDTIFQVGNVLQENASGIMAIMSENSIHPDPEFEDYGVDVTSNATVEFGNGILTLEWEDGDFTVFPVQMDDYESDGY